MMSSVPDFPFLYTRLTPNLYLQPIPLLRTPHSCQIHTPFSCLMGITNPVCPNFPDRNLLHSLTSPMSINNFFLLLKPKTSALSLILSLFPLTPYLKMLSALLSEHIYNLTISPRLNCCHLVHTAIISCLDI